jgi:hypothetical protein
MTGLTVVQGAYADWPLQAWNRGSQTAPAFAAGDTLAAYVYAGSSQAQLFAPAVAWYTAGGTQTGYAQGQVLVSPTAAQTATLEAGGTYTLIVWWTQAGGGKTAPIWRGTITVEPAAGTSTEAVAGYCQLADILQYAPWVTTLQNYNADTESFYAQRLQAREWLDWLIVRSWRGTSAAYFGDAGRSAQFWLGSWVRRTPLPSYWLIGQLAGGFFLSGGITITNTGSGYTAIPTVTAPAPPAGSGNATATLSANLNGAGGIGSIFVNTQGQGYTPGGTYTLTIAAPGGSGATATATAVASSGVLIQRPQITRICAYKAISIIGLAQIGLNNQQAAYGAYFRDLASSEVLTVVAELDLNGDGIADLPIPINPTNTMFT